MNTAFRSCESKLRRSFLRAGAKLAVTGLTSSLPVPSLAVGHAPRRLSLLHTHTLERIDLEYAVGERHLPAALDSLSRFLRDHHTGAVGVIDPKVFDMLHAVMLCVGSKGTFEVISGYRCPATNRRLRSKSGGVAKNSLHMEGRAIDVRLPGVPLTDLRNAALSPRQGGVGFYPGQRFVHLDAGRVRSW